MIGACCRVVRRVSVIPRVQSSHFLQQKVSCYKEGGLPSEYYKCIRDIDEKLAKNADFLKTRFGQIEVIESPFDLLG